MKKTRLHIVERAYCFLLDRYCHLPDQGLAFACLVVPVSITALSFSQVTKHDDVFMLDEEGMPTVSNPFVKGRLFIIFKVSQYLEMVPVFFASNLYLRKCASW